MIILIKLLLAHFAGDFLLQRKSWVEEKEDKKLRSNKLYIHLLIHIGILFLLFWSFEYWLLIALLTLAHGIIDLIKLYAQNEKNKSQWFLADQGLHILSILGLWYIFFKPAIPFQDWYERSDVWIFAFAFLFITVVSGILIRELLYKWSETFADSNDESLKNAGKYIGMLERLFVFTFVISGNWEGIGFLLAAKSVFRFGDLKESKDRKMTEYILIGTLLSFGIAIATGMAVTMLVGTAK